MKEPFIADETNYLCKETKTTRTVYHPAVYFKVDKGYCFFPDEGTRSGLVEHGNKADALKNAEELYEHYILDI